MDFSTQKSQPDHIKTDCLILPITTQWAKLPQLKKLDQSLGNLIQARIKSGDIAGNPGQTLMLFDPTGMHAKRLLLVGCGNEPTLSARGFRTMLKTAFQTLLNTTVTNAAIYLEPINITEHDLAWQIRETILTLADIRYQFNTFKSEKEKKQSLKKLAFALPTSTNTEALKNAIKQGKATAEAIQLTKNLANTPPNICQPSYLAKEAKALVKQHEKKLKIKILEEKDMQKLGMGAFLSVSQGSDTPGKIIIIEYQGGKTKDAPLAFVGKGVTFDTGGNCIKPAAGMMGMKYDMSGAATIMGIMKLCVNLALPLNVIGVMSCAENMLNGSASRLTDVVKTMSGLTVEITNTDAEGRLVLCDAMTYVQKTYQPKTMTTIATLTGAAIVALGYDTTTLISNNNSLANNIMSAGLRAEDRAWQLPLYEEYFDLLKSDTADMVNASLIPAAGSITAACFLSKFAKDTDWAHLDIAGTSIIPGRQARASGRPLPLLLEYLLNETKK